MLEMTGLTPRLMIRPSRPEEYQTLGKMLVSAYAALPGMPSPAEVPDYYDRLANVAGRAALPGLTVFVAESDDGKARRQHRFHRRHDPIRL